MTPQEQYIINRLHKMGVFDAFHDFLQKPGSYGRLCTGVLGYTWERELGQYCGERGIPFLNLASKHLPYDCEINGWRVQAKTSSQLGSIDIRPNRPLVGDPRSTRAYKARDYDLLALKTLVNGFVYFVPSRYLIDGSNPDYMTRYFHPKRFGAFQDCWHLLTDPNDEPKSENFVDIFEEFNRIHNASIV